MIKKLFSKEHILQIATGALLITLILYTLYHVTGSSSGNLMTTPTRSITDTQSFTADAYLFRNETVLSSSQFGLVHTLVENDAKVSKNDIVAELYTEESISSLATKQARLNEIDRVIRILESSAPSSASLSKPGECKEQAASLRLSVKKALGSGTRYSLSDDADELLIALNRYQILTGSYTNNDELLSLLKEERAELLSSACIPYSNTEASGYFYDSSYIDGFEGLLSASALEDMTVEAFDRLAAEVDAGSVSETDGYAIGKIAYGYEWYLAFHVGEEQLKYFEVGSTHEAQFPTNTNADAKLTLTCKQILTDEHAGHVVVLRCEDHPSGFQYLRKQSIKLTLDATKGYYVPSSAIRTDKDGAEGVYIYEDNIVRWRYVEALYRGDGYLIVAEQNGREGYLSLNDLLITHGSNLYDGKVY